MQPKARPEKPKESKYVSIFSDSEPDSDISFRDAAEGLLRQSAERYVVGVDNLTINMDGFSMIDQTAEPEVLLEVLLLQHKAATGDLPAQNATWLDFPAGFRYAESTSYQVRNDGTNITTFADLIIRLNEIAAKVHENMKGGIDGPGDFANLQATTVAGASTVGFEHHLRFSLDVTGQLSVHGSRLFWATHMIHIPKKKYQRIFLGTDWRASEDQRILSLSPFVANFGSRLGVVETDNASQNPDPTKLLAILPGGERAYVRLWNEIDLNKFNAQVGGAAWLTYLQTDAAPNKAWREIKASYKYRGNLYSTLDRRVCIEVGTSLPLKNSPLVEDNIEASDFILGRFFIDPELRIESDEHGAFREIHHHGPSVHTLMDGTRRVLYHQLHPQQKITTMRIKLYARVRTYNETTDTWSMRVISLPTQLTDWWHIRLHFKEIETPSK